MAEYIERDNYCKNICLCNEEKCDKERCSIHTAPTADVVPVVRCKDCRKSEWLEDAFLECKHYFCRIHNFCAVNEDGFCDLGERRCEDE